MKFKSIVWKTFLYANWAVILFYWFQGSGKLLFHGTASTLIALGSLAGLAAAYTILLQFFFMGRLPWLERVFGLDRLSRLHQKNGKVGLALITIHPILLITGYSMLSGTGWWAQFILLLRTGEHVVFAFIGFILFFIVVGVSIRIVRSRLRYESWYFVHLLAYLAVFTAFFHQLKNGSDLLASRVFFYYWIGLYILVFASHLTFRFLRPAYLFFRHKFVVGRIVRENASAVSIYISGRDLNQFSIHPGQFMIVRFLNEGLWWQAHPFSLSIIPNKNELRITIKEVGDFTKQLNKLTPGTKILIDGPYGVFTNIFGVSSKVLMIAGGIGITPIRSLMEEMLSKGKEVVLLYANRTEADIVFRTELDALAKKYSGKITHILSDQQNYAGEVGRLDQEKLRRLVPDIADRDIYLCGPVPMMDGLLSMFETIGIPKNKIHYEKFSF